MVCFFLIMPSLWSKCSLMFSTPSFVRNMNVLPVLGQKSSNQTISLPEHSPGRSLVCNMFVISNWFLSAQP